MELRSIKFSKKTFKFICLLFYFLGTFSLFVYANDHKNLDAEEQFKLGVTLLINNQLVEAEVALLSSLKLSPQNGKFHWETGWLYWKKQEWRKVISHWELTQKYSPKQIQLEKFLTLALQYERWNQQQQNKPLLKRRTNQWKGSQKNKLTFVAVGDLMMGSDFNNPSKLPPFEGTKIFNGTSDFLKGDLVFANLEGPLTKQIKSDKCRGGKKCFVFRTPPEYGKNLANAGFSIVNLANNHVLDFGLKGLKETLISLKQNNIEYFGSPGRGEVILTSNDIDVAFLGVATHYCCQHINQIQANQKKVKDLRKNADIVIVSFHGGGEGLNAAHVISGNEIYLGESRGDVRKFAHAMIDAGADLVIGHGPHTLRGMELYKKRPIVYSLGNFLGYKAFSRSGHLKYSMILKVQFSKQKKVEQITVIPLILDSSIVPMFDSKRTAFMILNELSQTDFGTKALLLDGSGIWKPES